MDHTFILELTWRPGDKSWVKVRPVPPRTSRMQLPEEAGRWMLGYAEALAVSSSISHTDREIRESKNFTLSFFFFFNIHIYSQHLALDLAQSMFVERIGK